MRPRKPIFSCKISLRRGSPAFIFLKVSIRLFDTLPASMRALAALSPIRTQDS